MPTLSNLRQRFFSDASSSKTSTSAQDECLIADTRCRISPVQAVERKLGMILGRERHSRGFGAQASMQSSLQ
ncbi:hypothetical protein GC163_10175 [bacterium]|nr:hypothetical protein [bacterium]